VVANARAAATARADPLTTPFVTFSAAMASDLRGLKAYLFERVYRHPKVMRVMGDAEHIVRELTLRYLDSPLTIPSPRAADIAQLPHRDRAGPVLDFVAGMTDRYAIAEHRRLFEATPTLR
jgi:dGTPase